MVDNVAVTAGTGTTIATDDVSTVHYQRVKLVNGTLDATDAIPGDATNGLDVDVTRLPASTNTLEIVGDVAQDAAVAGNPVLIGLRASDPTPTAMSADGDAIFSWADRNGRTVVTPKCDTAAQTSVAASATSVTVLAVNNARTGATIYNDSSVTLFLKLGATASSSSFSVKMAADGYYEVPFGYVGVIDGIWASATGNVRVTELS